jgi:hypothetical protein
VQISNKLKGGYRFGYNGQEKVDEIAGAGNHTTAEFWEYDTRLGRRWNRDPKKNEWESDYAVMQGDPILRSDPLGDYSKVGAWWRNIRDNGGGIHKSKGEWGYYTAKKDPNGDAINLKFHDGSKERDKQRFLSDQKRRRMMAEMGGESLMDGNDPALEKYEKWGLRERLQFFFDMSWPAFLVAAPQLSLAKAATIGDGANGGATIIGEGMARVEAAASKIPGSKILNNMPAFTGKPWEVTSKMMQYNRQWILNELRSGRAIIDIGRDATRANPSIFYQMEQNMIKNYKLIHP